MKSLAHSYVWWPGVHCDVEDCAKSCTSHQKNKASLPKPLLHLWVLPTVIWQHIHADYARPVGGKMLLVITDEHYKWPEVFVMTNTTSSKTTAVLVETFTHFVKS